jgi:hypothetical protein
LVRGGVDARILSVASLVLALDHLPQTLPRGGEVVLEFSDMSLCEVGLGGAGVAFGGELASNDFEVGDACDELGPLWPLDLCAEL